MKKEQAKKFLKENKEYLEKWIVENGNKDAKTKLYIRNDYADRNDLKTLQTLNWYIGIQTGYSRICDTELRELQNEFDMDIDILVTDTRKLELRLGED